MSEERGKDSPSEMSVSVKQSVRSGSLVSRSVSVKSDRIKGDRPNFRGEKTSTTKSVRSGSHVLSSVSVKSDHSKGNVPNFSEKTPCNKSVRSGSHVFSFVSMKSDHSKGDRPNFSEKTPSPSKSNKGHKSTVNIGEEITRWEALKAQKGLKSDVELATFLLNRVQFDKSDSNYKNYRNRKNFSENLLCIFKDLENKIIVFIKKELEKFKKILKGERTQYFVQDFTEEMHDIKEAALDITLFFLNDMKQYEAADALQHELVLIQQQPLKSNLKKKYQSVSEGIAKHGDSKLLKNIYTDLCMTLSVSKQVNIQNEVGQVQAADRRHESREIPVECKNLFEAPEPDKKIRTVLTKGVAGIGKSISVQKFILDWADSKENQDITFIFPLPLREMNLKEKETQSLTSLLHQFFPEIKGVNLAINDKFKLLFILDGLDECRLPLNFEGNEICRDVTSQVSLDVLLTNLIKGNLLPSALIWITTRPAAASKIPPDCIDRVTVVKGFNDAQKKEYFRKRFTDGDLASEIIDNVRQSKSLFIMCHIPVFCWITATVLQNILEEKRNNDVRNQADEVFKTLQKSNTEDTPKTLTQMYTHFLRFQILQSRRKYDGQYTPDVSWDKDAILSLGKLAFQQLQRNNLLFYDTDLESCGIDASNVSVYSGMCTQIFKEERGIILGTTFCFVHLSIQEFIAALYAHLFLDICKKSVFNQHESTEQENKNETMIDLLKTAVDKALESETGHLDLFLRFLLGLSLQTNRPLLRGLLTQQDNNDENYKEIVQYIKEKLEDKKMSPERSINLFYCLNELNDQTLVKEIQTQLREGSFSSADLSPAQWSVVAFVLLTSEEEMEEFDLQKFKKSDECLFRLLEVVKISKRALLNDCNLTDESCSNLAKALGSDNNLIELNMSNNNLLDSGVKQLCIGLENITCKLETLELSNCDLTEESCSALASVLSSDSSSLRYLDLSNNDLKDSGIKLLSDGLKENCKLKKLR
ncbi:NACHT, LRR and PYD domains-containing protein 3-like [Carassius auratus]|uniref:NACHT, LRR and PYD domains-containing protein 3-like n=1 Tax=Carassius auratus TaxID=7957 RepID=A0A6P6PAK2_CARAU|nr:NACHT, LRR and PYD domains-containing protein 3-like [Carassius auratus]